MARAPRSFRQLYPGPKLFKAALTAVVKRATAFFRQFTDQPVGFERIAEPRFRPAMREACANERGMEVLPILVEKREFSAWL